MSDQVGQQPDNEPESAMWDDDKDELILRQAEDDPKDSRRWEDDKKG